MAGKLSRLTAAVLALLFATLPARGDGTADGPVEVRVGVFLNAVPEVDLQSNTFTFDAYVWFVWDPEAWPPKSVRGAPDAPESPASTFEVVQSRDLEKTKVFGSPGYVCMELKGKRLNFWDVRDYPFERQKLELVIEDSSFETKDVRYVADTVNSGVTRGLSVSGATTRAPEILAHDFVYPTNFGDPDMVGSPASNYSRITFTLPIDRAGIGVFFKLFTALFVSTLVALIALFISPTQVDPRFGLCVGGLFGTVASSYAVSSWQP